MYRRENFTAYEIMPEGMDVYLSHFGPHFNKKLVTFAMSQMTDDNDEPITPIEKNYLDSLLSHYGVKIKHNILYDAVYVANMIKADFYGKSIQNDELMLKHIKCMLDDPDGEEGLVFNRWVADMKWLGIPIDWEEML